MQPLSCRRCGTSVQVKKNSLAHTSVQWDADSRGCAEFAERLASSGPPATAVIPTCLQLRGSIEDAVREGVLAVPEL
ncbi:hypothetical protein [Amycolatopsis sp. YIM 10]|uniref:hypothetical protein n=1 Tax=Amycolatopsis sp. YIM 10 TaxID=2653857 RepID=UPI0012901660|nr:hypothetical protein [Amycolatopsis sp. YIM 10]QFU92506.1 hypothetical protein YIM_36735 [Amycolatopsis sp. YIM 10]